MDDEANVRGMNFFLARVFPPGCFVMRVLVVVVRRATNGKTIIS
jgi:hypothetical protein